LQKRGVDSSTVTSEPPKEQKEGRRRKNLLDGHKRKSKSDSTGGRKNGYLNPRLKEGNSPSQALPYWGREGTKLISLHKTREKDFEVFLCRGKEAKTGVMSWKTSCLEVAGKEDRD